jgi:hypothetical protein
MGPVTRLVRTLQPYWLHLFLLVYAPAILVVDGHFHGAAIQPTLGALTLAALVVCMWLAAPERRFDVWVCLPVAAGFEVLGSLIWQGYTYRMHNIPLYVPPGHALVFLFGLTACGLPLVRRHERAVCLTVLGICTVWTLGGLTILPLWTHRVDVQGLTMWPLFAWCVLRSGRGSLFAGIWLATAVLEIAGTWAGDWSWAAVAPWSHLPSGNPPSAVAAGYAIIDGTVAIVAPLLLRTLRDLRLRSRVPSPEAV